MILRALLQQRQFGFELGQKMRATRALTFSLLRVEAQDIALAPFALANPYLFDLQVVGDLLVAAGPCQHLFLDIAHPAHWYGQNVTTQSAAELSQVVGRVHPGITDKQAAAEPPGTQIVLDPRDRRHVGGVAWQYPRAHRHA